MAECYNSSMKEQDIPIFLLELFDYADYIADRIQPNSLDNSSYFLTLVYIEDIMDAYGRGLIYRSLKNSDEVKASATQSEAVQRLELLRGRIRSLSQQYDFDDTLTHCGKGMYQDWHKLDQWPRVPE